MPRTALNRTELGGRGQWALRYSWSALTVA